MYLIQSASIIQRLCYLGLPNCRIYRLYPSSFKNEFLEFYDGSIFSLRGTGAA
jgi:hypothetical protein